jgi:hypothetical protein
MRQLALVSLLAASVLAAADYKAAAAGEIPAEVAAPLKDLLEPKGAKIMAPDGSAYAEVWLVKSIKLGAESGQANTTLGTLPHGTFMGVIKYAAQGQDRRGQNVKPGVYTLRHSLFPINGDHQGVSPQRDFLVLSRASEDTKPEPIADFDALMTLSRKVSGTPHPSVLSYWKEDSAFQPGFAQQGETDWVWQVKVGDVPLAIILIGKSDH